MKSVRKSATVILAARNVQKSARPPPHVNYDYNLLCLKRHRTSKFMPSAYVFPGGIIEPSDADPKWHNLFSAFGFNENSFSSLIPEVKTRPLIFEQQPSVLPREISLRITAIRETFEECGILLCRNSKDGGTCSNWAQHIEIPKNDIHSWQKKVCKDATEFYSMCENFNCYPDLWALYEWSNWLTPTALSTKRYDAVFFMACLQNKPQTVCHPGEIELSKWDVPANFVFSAEKIILPNPQMYEIARIAKFESIDNLLDFAMDRTTRGVLQMFPVKVKLQNGSVYVMLGDSKYPKQVSLYEEQVINEPDMTIEQFQEISPVKHRIEFYDCKVKKVFVQNFDNQDSHLAPMQLEAIHVI